MIIISDHSAFITKENLELAGLIADEFLNLNTFPLYEFEKHINDSDDKNLSLTCRLLYQNARNYLQDMDSNKRIKLLETNPILGFRQKSKLNAFAIELCILLIQMSGKSIDNYVDEFSTNSLNGSLSIQARNDGLVDVTGDDFVLMPHGIVFKSRYLIKQVDSR